MTSTPIILEPGVSGQETMLLNQAKWSLSRLIRFKNGLLEKRAGWIKFSASAFTGKCRGLFGWSDDNGNFYLAAGTHTRLLLYTVDFMYDITPLRATASLTPAFSTTDGDATVNINDAAHGGTTGDGLYIVTPVSVGGLVLHGYYAITVVDADNYTIEAAANADATVAAGGATALFSVTNTSAEVTVTLADHGYAEGEIYTVYVSTAVGGITLLGDYTIDSISDADNFVITAASSATSTTTGSENAGNAKLNYLIAAGNEDAQLISGYGIGGYGEGEYGYGGDSDNFAPPRQWHMVAWGEDLIAAPTNGPLYLWDTSGGLFNNVATEITQAPDNVTAIIIAMPQRQIVALGAEDNGVQDKLLIKWSDTDSYITWRTVGSAAVAGSQAGYYRIPRGSKIVGGMQAGQQILVWTDLALWLMTYIGSPYWYSVVEIAPGCGLIGSRAMGMLGTTVMWLSRSGFFMYAGGKVIPVPCDVWDIVFANLNEDQIEKITCATTSKEQEFEWFIPSLDGNNENDISVKFNLTHGVWDFSPSGALIRTAWLDVSVWGNPIGADVDGYLYQHELGANDDEDAMTSYGQSGWFALDEGDQMIFLERFLPDFNWRNTEGNVKITITMKEWPADEHADNPVTTFGPYSVNAITNYAIVRGRNRYASIKIESDEEDVLWRLGKTSALMWPDGRR